MSEDPKRFFRQEALEHFSRAESYDEPLALITLKRWCLYLACILLIAILVLAYEGLGMHMIARTLHS